MKEDLSTSIDAMKTKTEEKKLLVCARIFVLNQIYIFSGF
jgi:hypothetical protein